MSNDNAIIRVFKLWAKVSMMIVDGTRDPTKVADVLQVILNQSCSWYEQDGIIYFSVTSDGTTGEGWITRIESKGFRVGDSAKRVLRTSSFKPTSGVTTEVAVLKGMLFKDDNRITKTIRAEAHKRKLSKPNAELACLIREKFTDKEVEAMGLRWIVAMHEPINDSDGGTTGLLAACRSGNGRWLSTCEGRSDGNWRRECGFAFGVLQVGPQS